MGRLEPTSPNPHTQDFPHRTRIGSGARTVEDIVGLLLGKVMVGNFRNRRSQVEGGSSRLSKCGFTFLLICSVINMRLSSKIRKMSLVTESPQP